MLLFLPHAALALGMMCRPAAACSDAKRILHRVTSHAEECVVLSFPADHSSSFMRFEWHTFLHVDAVAVP